MRSAARAALPLGRREDAAAALAAAAGDGRLLQRGSAREVRERHEQEARPPGGHDDGEARARA